MSTANVKPDLQFNDAVGGVQAQFQIKSSETGGRSRIEVINTAARDVIFQQVDRQLLRRLHHQRRRRHPGRGGGVLLSGGAFTLIAGGDVGTSAQRLQVKETMATTKPDGTPITDMLPMSVAAGGDVYLSLTGVNTKGTAYAAGDRVGKLKHDIASTGGLVDVRVEQGIIMAPVTVGNTTSQVAHNADGSYYFNSASSAGNLTIDVTHGDLTVGAVDAGTHTAALTASGSILDAVGDAASDVDASTLMLTAGGSIGLGIDSSTSGTVSATAGQNITLVETSGVIRIGNISAGADLALTATSFEDATAETAKRM